jgi:ribosomal protein S18 acetylase RimI-like enzyme
VKIREARADDAEALARLLDQLGYPASAEAVERRLARLAASDSDRVFVAELQGSVVGFAAVHVSLAVEYDEPAAKLSAIAVDEEHRRRGIGEALVAAAEEESRARGCGLLFLTTAERRADAHAFYERIGFEHTGRRYVKTFN